MGREGGNENIVAKSKEEVEDVLQKKHTNSKRRKRLVHVRDISKNKNEAIKTATIEETRLEDECGDNYNYAVVVPFKFSLQTEEELNNELNKEMESEFKDVEKTFLRITAASKLSFVEGRPDMVSCYRCQCMFKNDALVAQIERKQKKRIREKCMEGICPVCQQDEDDDAYCHVEKPKYDFEAFYDSYQANLKRRRENNTRLSIEYEEKKDSLNSMLLKIEEGEVVQNNVLFDDLRYRMLYKQPEHSLAIDEFKKAVGCLLPKRDELLKKREKTNDKGDVNYLVRISWLSSHDEWQHNDDMDYF